MKYKYSRKLLAKAYGGYDYEKDFLEDLLATKPEKECKHERVVTTPNGWEMWVCPDCHNAVEFKPNPSPLDEIEEIRELGVPSYIADRVNILIRNQNKIISYLKKR